MMTLRRYRCSLYVPRANLLNYTGVFNELDEIWECPKSKTKWCQLSA